MSGSKILAVTGAFVPANDTVTILSYKHLCSLGEDVDVIALKAPEDKTIRECLKKDKRFSKFHIEYFCRYDQAMATYEKKNVISAWINYHRYCRYALKKAEEGNYKIIYTSSVPVFDHLAGYYIKKKLGDKVTWIASFSDPINHSPYKYDKETIHEYSFLQKIGFYVYISLFMHSGYEKLAQKYADKVIYIDEEQRDFQCTYAPDPELAQSKAMIVPLNYLKDWDIYSALFQGGIHPSDSPMIFSHFGRIYGLRLIGEFLDALKELKDEDPDLSKKIQFHTYGELIPRWSKKIKELDLSDVFIHHEKIPYNDALTKMKESYGLVLFDTIMPDDKIQPYFPSKSLEYALLKKHLLIITTKRSPAFHFFQNLGYTCCRYEKEDIKKQIKAVLFHQDIVPNYDAGQFENEKVLGEFRRYIHKIIGKEKE